MVSKSWTGMDHDTGSNANPIRAFPSFLCLNNHRFYQKTSHVHLSIHVSFEHRPHIRYLTAHQT